MSANAPTPVAGYSDEIDLSELVRNLWKQKLLISLVTAVVTVFAARYAFLSAPVYEGKTSTLPPRSADIAGYNLGRTEAGFTEFTTEGIYAMFTQNLRSEGLRRDFFEQVYQVVRLIPEGRVTSYGAIAAYLGVKRSARMVGWAMNGAHHMDIPAHRVVNRNGNLSGKMHFATPNEMERLLSSEGIVVKDDTIQHFRDCFWDPMTELAME